MRTKLLASAALIVGAGFALPAAADINVVGTVTYDKNVDVTETLTKTKVVLLNVRIANDSATAAESNAVINQRIGDGPNPAVPGDQLEGSNTAIYLGDGLGCPSCVAHGQATNGADFSAKVTGSLNGNAGATQYNQDVGYASNQNNTLSAAVGHLVFFTEANNSAAQYNNNNSLTITGRLVPTDGPQGSPVALINNSLIVGSVNNNIGLVQANQNSGNFNNQLNSASIAIGFTVPNGDAQNAAVALAETDLGQWNTGQHTVELRTAWVAGMSNSVSNNTGVVMGNQAAGQMANQGNMLSLSAGVNWGAGNAGMNGFIGTLPPNF